ncbi:PPR domain-containing protein/PPR_2 domain-containing protein, partial [Cephalotus follicularis]
DTQSLARILQSFNTRQSIYQGKQLHMLFLKKGLLNSVLTIGNRLLLMYVKCGYMSDARKLFEEMPLRNSFTWNAMIEGYMKSGHKEKSLELFDSMPHQNDFSWNVVISGFAKAGELDIARRFHLLNMMKEQDDFSLSALISGYANCGRTRDARRIFDRKVDPCVVLWNSMIAGYVCNNEEMEALVLFNKMQENSIYGDASTLSSVLSACSSLGICQHIKGMHGHALKVGLLDDIVVAGALIDAYSKLYSNCGRIEEAKQVFRKMSHKSLISWNSMIVALSQNSFPIEALDLFCKMNKLELKMDKFSLASAISACASISSLEVGEHIFARATIIGLEYDQIISTSLVDFYCKCGFVEYGRKIFDAMTKSDEFSWNSMLMGYATNGHGYEALSLFKEMRNAGLRPSDVTFTGVLSACDHCGLVEEGRKWFDAMKWDYHIDPGIEHCSCMVDLFARAGCLEEAINLIEQMPFEVNISLWSAVLRGCVAHGDKNLGKKVAERIIELDPENSDAYVQLSSIFAIFGDWERSALVRKVMREKQVKKSPGCSW